MTDRMRRLRVILTLLALAMCCGLQAHPETLLQIAMLTDEISRTSHSGELLIRRGELYLEHDDTTAALADLLEAVRTDTDHNLSGTVRKRASRDIVAAYLRSGKPDAALQMANELVNRWPEDAEGWLARATVYEKTLNHQAAADDLQRVCDLSQHPDPDLYRRRAKACLATDLSQSTQAVLILDEGRRRLGDLIVLNEMALDIEERAGAHDAALRRVSALVTSANRKEHWLVRKGDILAAAGQHNAAALIYREAANLIVQLPSRIRDTTSTKELEARAQRGINCETLRTQ